MIPLNDILEKLWGQRYNQGLLGGGGHEGTLGGTEMIYFLIVVVMQLYMFVYNRQTVMCMKRVNFITFIYVMAYNHHTYEYNKIYYI